MNHFLIRGARFGVLGAMLALGALAQAQTGTFVLTNAKIVRGDGSVLEKGSILVTDGKISAVGANIDAKGATAVDLSGRVVYPGFFDAYARGGLKVPDAPEAETAPAVNENPPIAFWNGNRRGIRSEIDASKILDPEALGAIWHEQGIAAANFVGPAGLFSGSTALFRTGGKSEDALWKAQVAQTVGFAGGGGGGGGGGGYGGSIMGRFALIRQMFFDAQWEADNPSKKKDESVSNLVDAVKGRVPVMFYANSEREIQRSLMLADEFNLKPIIVGGREAWKLADQLKKHNVGVILEANPGNEPSVSERNDGPPKEVLEERRDLWRETANYAERLADAGVPFAFTSGSARSGFLDNVRKHYEFGLDLKTLIAALTKNAAQILGVGREAGDIAPGMPADLTIMDGDLEKEGSKVVMMVVKGERIELKKEEDK